ncbi:hypothetical protein E3A20_03590 [Planctomyces bekefii]|uniref:Polysaccharide biosynthesis protein C-terminal domain-containing protein n=1 Tax=Planctomyces bekefii TaxID=1653850 RepID=A0A5C6MDB2_9PLAN|nr:hypothetical protein E3A20_03590 [Planctomyces bekefii]
MLPLLRPYLFPAVEFYPYLFLGLVNSFLSSLSAIPYVVMRIKQLPKIFAALSIATFSIYALLGIVLIAHFDMGLNGYYMAQIASNGFSAVFFTALMLRWSRPCLRNPHLQESWKFAVPLLPSSIASSISSILDRFLFQRLGGLEALGLYSLGLKFVNIVMIVHSTLKLSYGPFFYKTLAEEKDPKATIARVVDFYIFPYFMAGVAISIFVGQYVHWINKVAFFPIVQYVPFLISTAILSSLYTYYAPGIVLSKRTKLLMIPAVLQLVGIASGAYLLVPAFGVWGMIAAKILGASTYFGVAAFIGSRVFLLKFHWMTLLKMSALSAVTLLLHSFINLDHKVLNLLASSSVLVAFMVAAIPILGVSYGQVWNQLKRGRVGMTSMR